MPIKIPIDLPQVAPQVGPVHSPSRALWDREITWPNKGLNDVRKERLFRELHMLLNAGVDPRSVLDLLFKAQNDQRERATLGSVREAVLRGDGLSRALETAGAFNEFEVQSVRIGEESGRLAAVCQQVAEHHADRIKLRRMVRQAIAYPLFVLCVTLGVVFFMMNIVVPMFAQVFARSGAELPPLTRHVLTVSGWVRKGWPFILLVVAGAVGATLAFGRHPQWLAWSERIASYLPVLGEMKRKALLARFCRAMAFLLQSGSPLDRALELSERMSTSPRLRTALADIRAKVIRGSTLHQAMEAHTVFDGQLVAMIAVAEEVKQLDTMFQRLGERYMADVQHRTTMLGSVLEPAMILTISVLVGTVLVAMYLPMFKLSTTF